MTPAPDRHGSPAEDDFFASLRDADAAFFESLRDVWLGPDPSLALVHADMQAWREAHPCECEALCECEAGA